MWRGESKLIITSKENSKIKELNKLYSSKKEREKQGLFVIEGIRGCLDAVKCEREGKIKIKSIFIQRELLEKSRSDLPIYLFDEIFEEKGYEITKEIADKISDVSASQGVFIEAWQLHRQFGAEDIDKKGKYVILNNMQDPGNIGTVIRTCDAFGVSGVVLTGNCADVYNPKTVRSAVGSMPRVKIYIHKDFSQVVGTFNELGIKTAAAVIQEGIPVYEFNFDGETGCAVVIGNEGRGLSNEEIKLCKYKVSIPMKGSIDSLNASAAAAVLIWEMTKVGFVG